MLRIQKRRYWFSSSFQDDHFVYYKIYVFIFLDKDFAETVFPKSNYPQDLKKKVSLIDYFRKYMNEHLLKV